MLDDGTYDGIVVDAEEGAGGSGTRLEVAILGGARKGEVVVLHASGLGGDPLDRLGMPVTLSVVDGEPRVAFDQ
jgi:hypothetical protein